jgi:GWxTD domain-containing protein
MKTLLRFAVALLIALPLAAADLGEHSGWADTPQGWFMTKAERAQWATLTTEAEAAQFIAEFLARRDSKFAEEVATRVQKADQYFTVGETKGSKALRGKVVILLGPPSSMDVATKPARSRAGRSGSIDAAVSAGSDRSGAGVADVAEVSQRDAMSGGAAADKLYTLTYGAGQSPTKKDLSIVLEVDGASGRDKLRDKRAMAELEKVFEAAAEASLKK